MANRIVALAFGPDEGVRALEAESAGDERKWSDTAARAFGSGVDWVFFAELLDPVAGDRTVYLFAAVDREGRALSALEWGLVPFAEDWANHGLDKVVLLRKKP